MKRLEFSLNDKVVYQGYGVAKISRIIKRKIGDKIVSFFELNFLHSEMTILVPVENLSSASIRKISSDETIKKLFCIISEPAKFKYHAAIGTNWTKRSKEYQGKINTGDVSKIGEIYRDLKYLATQKELSFGEKNLLHKIEGLLVQEISIVTRIAETRALSQLRAQCKFGKQLESAA